MTQTDTQPNTMIDRLSISQSLSIGRIATLACVLEVTAPKPGNVHRGADFEDVTFSDFLVSAVAVGEVFDRPGLSVGQYVLQAVQQTEAFVGTNTNLGIALLLSPLVAAVGLGGVCGLRLMAERFSKRLLWRNQVGLATLRRSM